MKFQLNFKLFRRFCFVGLATFLLNSCYNEPQFLGNNLIPDDDIYAVKTDTLFELSAYTVKETSFNTHLYTSGVLGYVNSEIFGSTKCSFVSRFLPTVSTEGYGGTTAKPDSMFLIFSPTLQYGNKETVLTINFHEITDTSVLWEPYNGLKNIDGYYNPVPLISATYSGETQLKVPIDTSFARLLMDSTALTNSIKFYTKFKGLYITCDDLSGDGGVAYNFSYNNIYLSLYYHYDKVILGKDSTISKTKNFYVNSSWFYQYINDYSKANPLKSIKYLNDSTLQDSVFYTQSLGGVYGKIQLDGVTQWLDSMPIVLHKAELIVGKYSPETTTPDSTLKSLSLGYKIDSSWALNQYGEKFIYSTLLRTYNQDYSFNITSHLQRVLEGEIKDKNLYVFPVTNNGIARAVLQSGSNGTKKMKLKLTYTKLR